MSHADYQKNRRFKALKSHQYFYGQVVAQAKVKIQRLQVTCSFQNLQSLMDRLQMSSMMICYCSCQSFFSTPQHPNRQGLTSVNSTVCNMLRSHNKQHQKSIQLQVSTQVKQLIYLNLFRRQLYTIIFGLSHYPYMSSQHIAHIGFVGYRMTQ